MGGAAQYYRDIYGAWSTKNDKVQGLTQSKRDHVSDDPEFHKRRGPNGVGSMEWKYGRLPMGDTMS